MSSDNTQSAFTYTSISSDSDGPLWGIPLMNADEFSEMDPYEEVSQQGQPEHLEYHEPLDGDIQIEDDDKDPEEIPMRSMSLRILMRLNHSRRTRLLSHHHHLDTIERGYLPGHDVRTIARAADRAEDVGYVRALQASERRMMNSIEEVNLRVSYQAHVRRQESKYFCTQLHDAQTDRRDIR
nr:hypothetical protein [Tanacetum cinerariifolium]